MALPDGVLEILKSAPLDAATSIPKIEKAAHSLYNLLNVKFEGGIQDIKAISDRLRFYNEQHDLFAKRLVKFFTGQFHDIVNSSRSSLSSQSGSLCLPRHEEIYTFLSAYKSLILLCRHQSPREHLEICTQFQNALGIMISKDLTKMLDILKGTHLIKRPNPEPSSRKIKTSIIIIILHILVFINPNLKIPQFSLNVGRTYSPSNKNFSSMRLLKIEDLPFLGDSEFVYPDQ